MDTFELESGYSWGKGKNRDVKKFRNMTSEEARSLRYGSHVYLIDVSGHWRNARVTSIKTWKRKADVEMHYKYGMYEFGTITIVNDVVTDGPQPIVEVE